MPTLLYGPDAFTVGADTNLDTYDANWVKQGAPAGDTFSVRASTDDVRSLGTTSAYYRRTLNIPLDVSIHADVYQDGQGGIGFEVRTTATPFNGYLFEYNTDNADLVLYRVTAGETYTLVASGGVLIVPATYIDAFLKVTGTNPVHLEAGDNTNGTAITYDDSNAARYQAAGGVALSEGAGALALANAFDNVSVWDEAAVPTTDPGYAGALDQDTIDDVTLNDANVTGHAPLPADVGSFVLTGQAIAARVARRITAATGSFGLTGQAVTLRVARKAAASTGLFSLAGQVIALRADRKLTAATGTFTLTGPAVTLQRSKMFAADVGTFTLTGPDVVLRYSGAGALITAATGTFTLTGQAARLARAARLIASSAVYALTSPPIVLRHGARIVATSGAFTLTGISVTLRIARRISMGGATFTLTGVPVVIRSARFLTAATGIFVLVGGDVVANFKKAYTGTASIGPRFAGTASAAARFDAQRDIFAAHSGAATAGERFGGAPMVAPRAAGAVDFGQRFQGTGNLIPSK